MNHLASNAPHVTILYRMEAAERDKRANERQAAKLRRKLQLADLRAKAGSRATGEARRKVERDKEAEGQRRCESEELDRMKAEEAKQLAAGDRHVVRVARFANGGSFSWETSC